MAVYQSTYEGAEMDLADLKSLAKYTVVATSGGEYTSIRSALAAGKTKLFVKNGTYNEATAITITDNNITIIGEDKELTKIIFAAGQDGVKIYANYITLNNITIDCETNSGAAALVLGDGQSAGSPDVSIGNNNTINNCVIKGAANTFCVYVAGASYAVGNATLTAFENNNLQHNNRITNCILESTWNGDSYSFSLQKNGIFSYNYCSGGRIAFYMCRDSECNNNDDVDSANQGIFIGAPSNDNIISNNRVASAASSGIKIQNQLEHTPLLAGQGALRNIISNNTITEAVGIGIEMTGTQNFECQDNNISNNTINKPGNHGIYLQDVKNNNINNNTINEARTDSATYARGSGIYMVQRVVDNNIIGNIITDTRDPYLLHCAIGNREDTTCTGNTIMGNKIKANNLERTIWVQSDENKILNNDISGGYYAGIYLNGASKCQVIGNTCKNNTNQADSSYYEIWMNNNSSDNIITGNKIISNATNKALQDIYFDSGSVGSIIKNNKASGTDNIYYEQITFDPNGFPIDTNGQIDHTSSTISFNDGDLTFTIEPAVTSFNYYWRGIEYIQTEAQEVVIDGAEGIHYIYFEADILKSTTTFTTQLFVTQVIVSIIYWDATNNEAIHLANERHGCDMSNSSHLQQHDSWGAMWERGCDLTDFVIGDGDDNEDAQFGVASGRIYDEDIGHALDAITSTTGLPIFYKLGADGAWRRVINSGFAVTTTGTGRLAWNEFTGGAWQLTEITNNDFVNYHIFATNDINYPYFSIMGQADYVTRNRARNGIKDEVNDLILDGLPTVEFTLIGSVIYQTNDGYGNGVQAKIVENGEGESYTDFRNRKINRFRYEAYYDI